MENPYAPPEVYLPPKEPESAGLLVRVLARLELIAGGLVCLLGAIPLGLLWVGGTGELRHWLSAGAIFTIGTLIIWAAWCLGRQRYLPQFVLLLIPALQMAMIALD